MDSGQRFLPFSRDEIRSGALENWLKERIFALEIEIGSGQGSFLCRLAKTHPDARFIGIDLNFERCLTACERAYRMALSNVRVVNMEGREFITEHVSSQSLRAIHIYFPTPYPASIGCSERLVSPVFLEEAYRTLISGGSLRIVTDHEEYFDEICAHVRRMRWWNTSWRAPLLPRYKDEIVGTPCELKYAIERPPQQLHLIK
jgi:tRNA (guanine-N7-)-methyltransferase